MDERATEQVLVFILTTLKRQLEYDHLIHGWVIALNESLQKLDPKFAEMIEKHPFYKGQPLAGQSTDVLLRNIDALIDQLK